MPRVAATPFVDFRDVFLAYDGQADFAVEDITLSIAPGEFVAIVGSVRLRQVHVHEARDRA